MMLENQVYQINNINRKKQTLTRKGSTLVVLVQELRRSKMESENNIYSRYQEALSNRITDKLITGVKQGPCINFAS